MPCWIKWFSLKWLVEWVNTAAVHANMRCDAVTPHLAWETTTKWLCGSEIQFSGNGSSEETETGHQTRWDESTWRWEGEACHSWWLLVKYSWNYLTSPLCWCQVVSVLSVLPWCCCTELEATWKHYLLLLQPLCQVYHWTHCGPPVNQFDHYQYGRRRESNKSCQRQNTSCRLKTFLFLL